MNKNKTFKVIQFEKDGKTLFFTGRYRHTFNDGYKDIYAKSIDKVPPSGRFYLKYDKVLEVTKWFNSEFFGLNTVLEVSFKKSKGYRNVRIVSAKETPKKVLAK